MPDPLHPDWLNALKDPATYPHRVSSIQFAETHISWVVLTGDWAYKLKKPVDFGFVDFTTLEKRRLACFDEVRLNQRTAPDLYDRVLSLTGEASGPRFEGAGPVLDYAVRMRQFPLEDTFDHRLARGCVSDDVIEELARRVAELHRKAAIAQSDAPFGDPHAVFEPVEDCLDELRKASLPQSIRNGLDESSRWFIAEQQRLTRTFADRKRQGFVRECHGDLHLGNIVHYQGQPALFDCLEFNPGLRWIDMISDIAFLVMDLHDRGAPQFAWRVLNEWLEQTGDYGGLQVLKYYLAYRALVRAKVAGLRLKQPDLSPADRQQQQHHLHSYVELASKLSESGRPAILIMHGVSGSGKSFVARRLAAATGAIQIRSDVERKRLFGTWPEDDKENVTAVDLYGPQATEQTYLRLQALTREIIAASYPVVVDATFLKKPLRQGFATIAAELNVPFAIIDCRAPEHVLQDRVSKRQLEDRDASDADSKVLQIQFSDIDAFDEGECQRLITVDTTSNDLSSALESIQKLQASGCT